MKRFMEGDDRRQVSLIAECLSAFHINLNRLVSRCALILILVTNFAAADEMQILTTEIPPQIFLKDGKLSGFCVEIVEEMQRRLGDMTPMQILPWARAYSLAQTQKNTVLVCPKRSPERESLFKWVGPLLTTDTDLFVKKDSPISIRSLDEVKRFEMILVMRGSYTYGYLAAHGFHNLYPVNDPPGMLRMLLANRAPVAALERLQMEAVVAQAGASLDIVKNVFHIQTLTSDIAFSKDTSENTRKHWQAALDAMKRDGSYLRIYKKWFANSASRPPRECVGVAE